MQVFDKGIQLCGLGSPVIELSQYSLNICHALEEKNPKAQQLELMGIHRSSFTQMHAIPKVYFSGSAWIVYFFSTASVISAIDYLISTLVYSFEEKLVLARNSVKFMLSLSHLSRHRYCRLGNLSNAFLDNCYPIRFLELYHFC